MCAKKNCQTNQYKDDGKCSCIDCSENCASCNSKECLICKEGYYLEEGKCLACKDKFENCAQCDKNTCCGCSDDYKLVNGTCEGCPEYTQKSGSLCVTKYNIGDIAALAIPSSAGVTIVSVGQSCSSSSKKCCWRGATAQTCSEGTRGYLGCSRTVYNWSAASAICSALNYTSRSWRLATNTEMVDWASIEGMMLCGIGWSTVCNIGTNKCPGLYINNCNTYRYWTNSANIYAVSEGKWVGPSADSSKSHAYSFRCVSNL